MASSPAKKRPAKRPAADGSAQVAALAAGGAAAQQLRQGDIILAVNGAPAANGSRASLSAQLASAPRPLALRIQLPARLVEPSALPAPP